MLVLVCRPTRSRTKDKVRVDEGRCTPGNQITIQEYRVFASSGGTGSGKGKASVIEQQMVFLVIRDTKKPGKKGKKKVMTGVLGVDKFGVKPKDAASALGRALGSGCTVTKTPKGQAEVQVQGDFMDRIPPVLRDVLKVRESCFLFL